VARRALQVVRDSPVILETEVALDELRDDWPDAAELRVAESVLRTRLGEKLAVRGACPLRDHDHAVTVVLHALGDSRQEFLLFERHLGKENDVRRIAGLRAREP